MVFITQQTLREMYVNIINCRESGLNINQRIKILKAKILKAMPLTLFTSLQAAKNIQDRPVCIGSSLPGVHLPASLLSSLRGGKEGSSDTAQVGRYNSRCGVVFLSSISVCLGKSFSLSGLWCLHLHDGSSSRSDHEGEIN